MIAECFTRLRFLLRGKRRNEVDDELQFHIEQCAEQMISAGVSRAEARRQALIRFGGVQRTRDEIDRVHPGHLASTIGADLRYALRVLAKSPGFTAVTLLTLALCIGANTLVFGLLDFLVLRPLDVPGGGNLYQINNHNGDPSMSFPDYLDLRDRNHSFTEVASYEITTAALDSDGRPMPIWLYATSGNYFDAVGVRPYLGRFFHASDIHGPSSAPYIVLNFSYWQQHFRADPSVINRIVHINKFNYTILGVAPRGFRGTELFFAPDLWVPTVNQQQIEGYSSLSQRGNRGHWVIGRLKPGVAPAQAGADLNGVAVWLAKAYPKDDDGVGFSLGEPGLAGDMLGKPVRAFVVGLMVLAGLILLAACTNLGGLFAARTSDRMREVSLRLALGSSRSRVFRQLFLEALAIAIAGGALGLGGGVSLMYAVDAWRPVPDFPLGLDLHADLRTCAVAFLLALISGLLFGMVPLRQIFHTDPYQGMKSGAAGLSRFRRITFRDLLLGAQIAVCAVLVTASLVAVRGMIRSLHSSIGFNPGKAVLINTDLDMSGYKSDGVGAMQRRMMETLGRVPGVTAVAYAERIPLNLGWGGGTVFQDETSDYRLSNQATNALQYAVSPNYFVAAETRLLEGRGFQWDDKLGTPRVAVINQTLSRILFGPGVNPIGRHFKIYGGTRIQIVGMVEDGKYKTLSEEPTAAMFFPITQAPSSATWLIVRSNRDAGEMIPALDRALRALDASLPLTIRTWKTQMGAALLAARAASMALGFLGLLGAILAVTGIFGMAAYSVSKRFREFGIRIALGAQRNTVLSAALGHVFRLLLIGSFAGLLLGLAASRVLSLIVYQATPHDPFVLLGVLVTMFLLGLIAAWIPAQRALRADPLMLLREE